ncbi:tyrosine protein kinase, partial [Extibacter muris]|nr:tyrosine protein kinase [Extibacter muris]
ETKEFKELIEFGEKNFDYVLVDTPPTGAAIDAAVVGKNVDGAVIVAAQNVTSSRAIINTKRTLEDSGVKIL